ncbi:MAG: WecB/TagA/CpsF family glycosyltransferase [Burkholderiaceae bacterium]
MPEAAPNFRRRVYCIMGVPIDAHSIESARLALLDAVNGRRRYVMITPNANFIALSHRDPVFRDSLLRSDVSLADGMSLVAIARLAGLPIDQRVAGSDLFESLCEQPLEAPVSVFLFGESNGVPEIAARRINEEAKGVVCRGWYEPAYASAEALSTDEIRSAISESQSDFLVVALGAQKGQRWIDTNIDQVNTPAVCHLGAVIKMTAGVVLRAPPVMRSLGLEWLWRIVQEPALWRRYRDDAFTLGRLIAGRLMPLALFRFVRMLDVRDRAQPQLQRVDDDRTALLRLGGDWVGADTTELRTELESIAATGMDVELDLADADDMDSALAGLLLVLRGHCLRVGAGMSVVGASRSIRSLLRMMCADYLLQPLVRNRLSSSDSIQPHEPVTTWGDPLAEPVESGLSGETVLGGVVPRPTRPEVTGVTELP